MDMLGKHYCDEFYVTDVDADVFEPKKRYTTNC